MNYEQHLYDFYDTGYAPDLKGIGMWLLHDSAEATKAAGEENLLTLIADGESHGMFIVARLGIPALCESIVQGARSCMALKSFIETHPEQKQTMGEELKIHLLYGAMIHSLLETLDHQKLRQHPPHMYSWETLLDGFAQSWNGMVDANRQNTPRPAHGPADILFLKNIRDSLGRNDH